MTSEQRALDRGVQPAQPLWRRVPSRDAEGRLLSDFMMLMPRLTRPPGGHREQLFARLEALCRRHRGRLHFVDLNLRLNLLWISVDASPGVIPELVGEIRREFPGALLVGHECGLRPEPPVPLTRRARIRARILRLFGRRRALCPPDSAAD